MSRLAAVTLILSLFTSASLAAPTQESTPKPGPRPAKVQENSGAQKETKETPPGTAQQTGAKKVDVRKKQGPGAGPAERADASGTPEKPKPTPGAAPTPKLDRKEMTHKLMLEERKHRERMARIARLRALAEQHQQAERIAALDDLLAKENARYARWMEEGKKSLSEKEFADVESRLRRGRQTAGARGATPSPAKKANTPGKEPGAKPVEKKGQEKDQVEKDGR